MYNSDRDVAIFNDEDIGVGGIVRDSVGDVMLATCNKIRGCPGVDIAEAIAARHSLGIAMEAGLNRIILESNSLKLIQHLNSRKQECSYFGLVVADILHLAKDCSFFAAAHIGRKGNGAAHKLAHISKNFYGLRVWIEEVPCVVNAIVAYDLANA